MIKRWHTDVCCRFFIFDDDMILDKNNIPVFLTSRDSDSHKGDYGHALLVAGSFGKMGAAVLAAKACMRAGVGLLTVHVPRQGVEIMQVAVPEAMLSVDADNDCFTTVPGNIERYDAVAVGPGLGTDVRTMAALATLLEHRVSGIPLVLDADALNIIARHPETLHLAAGAVITPHGREYSRLFGTADAQTMSDLHDLTIVCKAHVTKVYAPGCQPMSSDTGNAGMATAGSGDALTGLMLGLLSQYVAYPRRHNMKSATLQQMALLAVMMHGWAGSLAAVKRSQPAVIASDIVDCIGILPEDIV